MKRLIHPLFASILVTAAQAAGDMLIDDFESGKFERWAIEGTAFGKGYEIWAEALEPLFRKLLD